MEINTFKFVKLNCVGRFGKCGVVLSRCGSDRNAIHWNFDQSESYAVHLSVFIELSLAKSSCCLCAFLYSVK